jgi:hypothetical protein
MKHSVLLGLLGCLLASACGASAPRAPITAGGGVMARCEGPVTIQKQGDVRGIAATCGAIDGDLRVLGSDVTNLDGLEHLRSVRYLVVAGNPKLENVRGLRGLVAARGVTFMDNPALTSLEGLDGLSTLDAAVIANNGIRSLQGLGELRSAREVVVAGNPRLEDLSALSATAVVGALDVENNGTRAPSVAPAAAVSAASSIVPAGSDG